MPIAMAAGGLPRLPAMGDIHLWWLDLASFPGDFRVLSPDECARAQRFVFDRDRRRFIAAHAALRVILADYLGMDAAALAFVAGAAGKPALAGRANGVAGAAFNLSHSGDQAALAIAPSGDIGVDIEVPRTGMSRQTMLDMLGAHEREQAALLDDAALAGAFPVAWTRKEACLKALGTGLAGSPPRSIDIGLDTAARTVTLAAFAAVPGQSPATVHVRTLRSPAGIPTSVAQVGSPIGAIDTFCFPPACPAVPTQGPGQGAAPGAAPRAAPRAAP